MQYARGLLNQHELVMNSPTDDEWALVNGNHESKVRGKPKGESLGKQLLKEVDEDDGAKIKEGLGIGALWEESDVHFINLMDAPRIEEVELAKGITDVLFDSVLAISKEFRGESIWPWYLARGPILDLPPISSSKKGSSRQARSKWSG